MIDKSFYSVGKKNTTTFEGWLSKFNLRKVEDIVILTNGRTIKLNLMIEVFESQKKNGFV
jgi:hypothetical protein